MGRKSGEYLAVRDEFAGIPARLNNVSRSGGRQKFALIRNAKFKVRNPE